jgi:hypothetical protein
MKVVKAILVAIFIKIFLLAKISNAEENCNTPNQIWFDRKFEEMTSMVQQLHRGKEKSKEK